MFTIFGLLLLLIGLWNLLTLGRSYEDITLSFLSKRVSIFLTVFSFFFLFGNPFDVNSEGYRTVVQDRITKNSWVQLEQGFYFKNFFAKTTIYPNVVTIQLEREENRKQDISYFSDPTKCQFSDGTYADVGFTVKWKLPNSESKMLQIHQDYRNYQRLGESLADYSKECSQYSFQLMDSEKHYSGGKSELREAFQFQLRNGQYIVNQVEKVDTINGEVQRAYINEVKIDESGKPILSISDIQVYDIIPNFVAITLVDYEEIVDRKLKAKVDQSTKEAISKQTLVTAQQEALTAEANGKKQLAVTRATQEASKLEAVIQAQKAKEVAQENALRAKFEADKVEQEGRALAAKNLALVKAGLTPQEKAEWEYKTKVDVAKALSSVNVPNFVISGSGDSGANPMDALGVDMLLNIQDRLLKKE